MKKEGSFSAPETAEAPGVEDATSPEDLEKSVVVIVRGKPVTVHFDMGEITPRFRKRLAGLSDDTPDADAADISVEYLATVVTSWDLTDKQGRSVGTSIDDIEGVPYRDITAIMNAINGVASPSPNASGEQGSPVPSSSNPAASFPSDSDTE